MLRTYSGMAWEDVGGVSPHGTSTVPWERHLIGLLCRTGWPLSHERQALHRAAWSTVIDWGGDLGTFGVCVASRVPQDGRRPTDDCLLHPGLQSFLLCWKAGVYRPCPCLVLWYQSSEFLQEVSAALASGGAVSPVPAV